MATTSRPRSSGTSGATLGCPLVPIERHICTMAMCLAVGLPAKLSAAADALELANRKDTAGGRLMHQMSKPRRAHKDEDPAVHIGSRIRNGSTASTAIASRTSRLSASSSSGCRRYRRRSSLWTLSCQINERGFTSIVNLPKLPAGLRGGGAGNRYRACRAHRRRRHWHQPGRAAPTMAAAARLHFKEARP